MRSRLHFKCFKFPKYLLLGSCVKFRFHSSLFYLKGVFLLLYVFEVRKMFYRISGNEGVLARQIKAFVRLPTCYTTFVQNIRLFFVQIL